MVRGSGGLWYPGVRIENISYPLTISSIQAAVCSCLANGDNPIAFCQTGPASELLTFWVNEFKLEQENRIPEQAEFFDSLVGTIENIPQKLDELCADAVTIHSGFPVSAILETADGFITGVNVEVSSWALGLCAERVALSRAISSGYTKLLTMHIYAPESEFCSPCGACRQVLYEFMPDKFVELHHSKNSLSKHYVHHLLPYGITSGFLKNQTE